MRPRSLLLGAAALLLTVTASGCSSSDPVATPPSSTASSSTTAGATGGSSPSGSGSTAPPGTTGGGSTTSTTSGAVTTTTSRTSTSSTANSSTTRPDGGPTPTGIAPEDQQFCAKVIEAQSTLEQIDPTDDPEGALRLYQRVIADLANVAPGGVKADFDMINAVVAKAKTYEDLVAMGTPELRAASDRIDTWTNAHCGSTLNG